MDSETLRTELAKLHGESYGWALHCCRHNLEETEEVLQTSYLKVLDGRAQYRGQSQLKTWWFGVIRITAANERRLGWFRRLRLMRYEREAEDRATVDRPDAMLGRAEERTMLQEALSAMPRRQRQVLQLVFYHDLSLTEAAAVLGVSVGSTRQHYERGKQAMRKWLYESKIFGKDGRGGKTVQDIIP